MFSYDPIYDRLFDNKEFVEVLYRFHSSNWDKLDSKGKNKVLSDFVSKYCEILEIEDMKVKADKNKKNYAGMYMDVGGIVNVNQNDLEERSQYDVLDTLFHELRHNFQRRAVARNLRSFEHVDEEVRKEWKLNFLSSPRGYSNYIDSEGENSELYAYQPVEMDAFITGLSLTKKSYTIIKEKLGEDIEFYLYAKLNKTSIMIFFSDEEVYVNSRKKGKERVKEVFEKNNKELHIEKECLKIAAKTMQKSTKDMSIEEIMSLFSVYIWAYLEDDYKLELLQEYDSRVNKYKPIRFANESNSAFKINGVTFSRENIGGILNHVFSEQFKIMVDKMVAGIEPCEEELRKDLALNLYKAKGKRVNFVKDSDNFLLYSIQPFALFEGRTIIEWFKKLRDVEQKFYNVEKDNYESWIDFYDNQKYIPYIEKFYEKPFEQIYRELVDGMKKNVSINKKI